MEDFNVSCDPDVFKPDSAMSDELKFDISHSLSSKSTSCPERQCYSKIPSNNFLTIPASSNNRSQIIDESMNSAEELANIISDPNCPTNHTNIYVTSERFNGTTFDGSSLFPELQDFRKAHHNKLIFAHLNINSLRNKFFEVCNILNNGYCDILGLSETKLDDSFLNSQFYANDFALYRSDRNEHGGGVAFYVRSSIPHRIRKDIGVASHIVENLVLETHIRKEKCFFVLIYKPPNVGNAALSNFLESVCNICFAESKTVYIIGDLNVNMLNSSHALIDTFNILNLKNVIKKPTCFKNIESPTLLDVIITNTPKRLASTVNVDLGISDFHNFVGAATKLGLPPNGPKVITYRSMKHFKEHDFMISVKDAPFHVGEIFDDVNDQMWYFQKVFESVVEQHAPTKVKKIKAQQVPFMNSELRKAINRKAALRKKYYTYKTQNSWESYKKQRNLVNKLKRKAKQEYFNKQCNNNLINNQSFWKTVKPFFSNTLQHGSAISLEDQGQLVTDPSVVCGVFNDHFVNIAESLAEPRGLDDCGVSQLCDFYRNQISVSFIRSRFGQISESFSFKTVEPDEVFQKCMSLKSNKAPGHDRISAKFIKLAGKEICHSLTKVINCSFESSTFPDTLKHALVTPVYKKGDNLSKNNYRPVSVLTSISKVFESIICDQINAFIEPLMSHKLSAYRKSYSCEDVLLRCIEDWKHAVDMNYIVGCVSMDLSKAFDSLPHNLLLAKLSAYGMSVSSVCMIRSYLSDRFQRVKICNNLSDWRQVKRGVPQGSLTGPLLFNVFINDFILQMEDFCDVYNYADDNSLSVKHRDVNVMINTLSDCSINAVSWFTENNMQANPEKFQVIIFHRERSNKIISLNVGSTEITSTTTIKLLGVIIDSDFSFDSHVSHLCKKAAKQVNALGRISSYLSTNCKMKILQAFIISNFTYCSLVYHLCGARNERKLEKLQERALRAVFGDYLSSYDSLLERAEFCLLHTARCRRVVEHVFRALHSLSPLFPNNYYAIKETKYNFRKKFIIMLPEFNTMRFGRNSIRYQAGKLWNALPSNVTLETELVRFKNAVMNMT